MRKFFSSMLCTSKIHPFSLGNYLGSSLIIGNLIISFQKLVGNFDKMTIFDVGRQH